MTTSITKKGTNLFTYIVSNHFVPKVKQVKIHVCPYPVNNTFDSKSLY